MDIPVPIMAVDDRPIASGLITQNILAHLSLGSHSETRAFAVVSVGYPMILGLDWLQHHNPDIDWAESTLTFNCCGTHAKPVTVYAKGSGPSLHPNPALHFSTKTAPMPPHHSSFLSSFVASNGFGHSLPTSSPTYISKTKPPPSPPNVKVLSARHFFRAARAETICLLRFHESTSSTYLNSFATDISSSGHPHPADSTTDYRNSVPPKYRPWADTVFNPSKFEDLPDHRPYDIEIELNEGKTPPFGPIYRLTSVEREAVAEYVNSNLRRGHIRRSTSSSGAPVLFTRKKTGDIRLCVDFRGLNAITRKNRYPLPLVNDLIDRVQGCNIFTVIDLKSAYSHLRIREGDEWKTAFRTHLGLFEHLIVPYGLTNAPAAWQSFIQDVLRDLLDIVCVVYLDDILIFSHTQEEHDQHVAMVLDRLRDAHLCANAAKCEFDRSEVEYLGFIISSDGIKMNPKKLDTISKWPEPTKVKELQSFLGFTNFYRRFIDGYSRLTLPLTELTKKSSKWNFSLAAKSAFEALKAKFFATPLLGHFDPSLPCTLATDASDFAISGILQQPDFDNNLHPIAFYSRKLSPHEINYDVHDKELLAIIESFRDMRAWLLGSPFPITVICDHKNLEHFMSSQVLNRRQARWAMFLADFDFRLHWRAGHLNPADAPSRRPDFIPQSGDDHLQLQSQTIITPIHTQHLFPLHQTLPIAPSLATFTTLTIDNSELLARFKNATQEDVEWRKAVVKGDSNFRAEGGLVFHSGRLYVPPSLRAHILASRHDSVIGGHPGRTRTLALVSRDYSWPGMNTYVRRYVEACDVCPRIKQPRHKPFGLLHPLDIPARPWQSITMDFIVKLPISHGFDSIWVVCDRLTRAAHFVPCCETLTAPDLAWLFLDRIFRLHGLPTTIISDRGSVFVSNFWKALTDLLNVDHRTSTAYHPQTDGLTERTNQTLETYLRAYCSYQQDDWVDYLPLAEFCFNNLENSSTRQTPFFANLAYHPTFEPQISHLSTTPAADDLARRLARIHEELRAELQHAQQLQAYYYDAHRLPPPDFEPDQLVWLLRRHITTTRPSIKLDHRRLGPYRVIKKIGPSSYLLNLPSYLSRLHPVFHVSLLEPYNDPFPFRSHASPEPFTPADDPALSIDAILDARKVGHRYDYFVHWKGQSNSENSWIPLSDVPTSLNELIDRFHRRHPRASRPHPITFNKALSTLPLTIPTHTQATSDTTTDSDTAQTPASTIRQHRFRAPSPPVDHQLLTSNYLAPPQTTTRSGRVSHPPVRYDPPLNDGPVTPKGGIM